MPRTRVDYSGGDDFNSNPVVQEPRHSAQSQIGVLDYLEALTYDFARNGRQMSCVLVYAQPDPHFAGRYQPVAAADTGYEGIACVDDTARAALLALRVYERTRSRSALALAQRWLAFVAYMQYPDGSFANFIRNAAGVRNASGPTSHRGGYWWSARALWALAAAYRITGDATYRESYERCTLAPIPDGKINAVLALGELELYRRTPTEALRRSILGRCMTIVDISGSYFYDHPERETVHLWGYHQLHAVAAAARILEEPSLLEPCRQTVHELIDPDVRALFWYSYPDRRKDGVCAYTVTPIVQGLAELFRATGESRYRDTALRGAAWFYGRNDARTPMYDASTGRCRDGITGGEASVNCGAESAIEAGLAELERRELQYGR